MINSQARYVDTHCHLDLYKNVHEIIPEAERLGILILGVTNTPSVFPYTENLSKQYALVRPAIGLHPELVLQRKHELPLFWDYLERTQFVGEIGLDYITKDQNERQIQREIFSKIIDRCSQNPKKILTVHSRRSASDVISILGEKFPGKIIMHWFSGTDKEAEKAISNGYYFSFNSAMVQSIKGRSLVLRIPKNRIITETDGPFVSVNGVPVRPTQIPLIIDSLAEILTMKSSEVRQQVWENYLILIGTV